MRRHVLSFVTALAVACGGATDAPASRPDDTDAGVDYEMRGVYRCCAPGIGTACCEGVARGMCFAYGGGYGDCRKAGETFEGKVICARCCAGLEHLPNIVPGDAVPPDKDGLPEGCDESGVPSIVLCGLCGDGVCGAGESFCNCPQDCPR